MGRFLADSATDALGVKVAEKSTQPTITTVTVLLSAATRLPLMWNDGKIMRLYRFETGHLTSLRPPP